MSKLKPLFARVLLERPHADKLGSVYVPEQYQKRNASLKCKVLAVGPNADKSIQVGMTVLIGQYGGAWLDEKGNPVPDGNLFVVQDEDCIVEVSGA